MTNKKMYEIYYTTLKMSKQQKRTYNQWRKKKRPAHSRNL